MDGYPLDIRQGNAEALWGLFPNIFSEGEIDWEKAKAAFSNAPSFQNERYTLNWAGNRKFILALMSMTPALAAALIDLDRKPQKVITLDCLFNGDDPFKTNTALQMHDAGVAFKTI